MIYTSYFAKMKNKSWTNQYSIARWTPNWFKGSVLLDLAPQPEWLNAYRSGELSEEKYVRLYLDYLEKNRDKILEIVQHLPNDSFLLCFESTGKFCHRKVLATWLQTNGIAIKEYEGV